MTLLSIICPSLISRDGVSSILHNLRLQAEGKAVEVLSLADNALMSTGTKMNMLTHAASGLYISGVADDDRVADDYVEAILEGIELRPDVITFDMDFTKQFTFPDVLKGSVRNCGLRTVAAIKAYIYKAFKFPDTFHGEDAKFRLWMECQRNRLKVLHIPKLLYHYDFVPQNERMKAHG